MRAVLLGYRVGTSQKSQREYCQMHLMVDPSTRDIEFGQVGSKVQVEFAPSNQSRYFKPSDIGKEVELDYEFSGNRAFLVSVTVLEKKAS